MICKSPCPASQKQPLALPLPTPPLSSQATEVSSSETGNGISRPQRQSASQNPKRSVSQRLQMSGSPHMTPNPLKRRRVGSSGGPSASRQHQDPLVKTRNTETENTETTGTKGGDTKLRSTDTRKIETCPEETSAVVVHPGVSTWTIQRQLARISAASHREITHSVARGPKSRRLKETENAQKGQPNEAAKLPNHVSPKLPIESRKALDEQNLITARKPPRTHTRYREDCKDLLQDIFKTL